MRNTALLREVPLFKTLPEDELTILADTLPVIVFRAGSLLLREGALGDFFYVIADGEVEVIRGLGSKSAEVLGTRGAGEIIGEFALLTDDATRTASVRAIGDVQALEVTRTTFDALLQRNPSLAYPMVRHLAARLHDAHARALRELVAAQDEVIQKRSMERELTLARSIQMRMIPRAVPVATGYDFGASLEPMSLVGGDFYDFLDLGTGRIGIVIGDVSGHGVPAALIMSVTMALIRLEAGRNASPSQVLHNVNHQLMAVSGGETFVTAIYGVFETSTGLFAYSRAGHEPVLLMDSGGGINYPEEPGGFPLGLLAEAPLKDSTLRLEAGATLVLYTDGVVEARNEARAFFGREGLSQVVDHGVEEEAQRICERVLTAVAAYAPYQPQQDDITVICIKAESRVHPVILYVDATAAALHEVREFVRNEALRAGVPVHAAAHLVLALDEAVTNVALHGYQGRGGPLAVTAESDAHRFMVRLRDKAPRYNPTQHPSPDVTLPMAQRPVGGLGIHIMRRSVDRLSWRWTEDGENELTMEVETGDL